MPQASRGGVQASRTIVCVYCGRSQQVGSGALSLPCRFCHKPLNLEDIRIAGYAARRVMETCGAIVIEAKGDVTVNRLTCAALTVSGKLKGDVVCLGPVSVGPRAAVRGDITAPALTVSAGAKLSGRLVIGGSG